MCLVQNRKTDFFNLFIILFIFMVWVVYAGKDISWDLLNHHLYLPFSLLSGRYASDYFAAGPQSYQNPLGYLPFYWIVKYWRVDWAVAVGLYAMQAGCLVLLYLISGKLWAAAPDRSKWCFFATLLGGCAPLFLQLLGTSSIDPFCTLLILWGVYCLLGGEEKGKTLRLALCGLLLGLAFALKQSSAIFILAIIPVLVFQCFRKRCSILGFVVFSFSGVLGFSLGMGWWSWFLWQSFGNPLFPFMNNIFHSPYASFDPIRDARFLPASFFGYVSRIWEMILLEKHLYSETFAPDSRPVFLLVFALAFFAKWIAVRVGYLKTALENCLGEEDKDVFLFMFFTYFFWMLMSGNGRYVLAFFLLTGVCLARLAWMVLPGSAARMSVLFILVIQCLYFFTAGDFRIFPVPFEGKPYVRVRVPDRLIREPFLHVVLGVQTNAFVAPYLNQAGAMTNPIGQSSLPMDGKSGERLKLLMAKWHGRMRMLIGGSPFEDYGKVLNRSRIMYSEALNRLGLEVDWQDCLKIEIPDVEMLGMKSGSLTSCSLVEKYDRNPINLETEWQANRVFKILETACPKLFSPSPLVSDREMTTRFTNMLGWVRNYGNSDAWVAVQDDGAVMLRHGEARVILKIGTVSDLSRKKIDSVCEKIKPGLRYIDQIN